jgi:predicted nucleotide-binding protein (sugar kinase/HSP70/actin superfamily)
LLEKDKAYEILLKLLEIEQNRINSLDSTEFTIKGLSVTLFSGFIGFAFDKKNSVFLYVGIIAVIYSSIIDFIYRKVQLLHVQRASTIQKYLKTEYLEKVESSKSLKITSEYKSNFINDYSPLFLLYFPMIIMLIVLTRFIPSTP